MITMLLNHRLMPLWRRLSRFWAFPAIGAMTMAIWGVAAASQGSPEAGAHSYSIAVHGVVAEGEPAWPTATPKPTRPAYVDPIDRYDWPRHEARAVRWCESTNNPNATGRAGEAGHFQIHPVHWWRFRASESPWNPEANTRVAYEIWLEQGWRPWTCRP